MIANNHLVEGGPAGLLGRLYFDELLKHAESLGSSVSHK